MNIPNQVLNLTKLGLSCAQHGLVKLHALNSCVQKILDTGLFLHEIVELFLGIPKEPLLILFKGAWVIGHVHNLEAVSDCYGARCTWLTGNNTFIFWISGSMDLKPKGVVDFIKRREVLRWGKKFERRSCGKFSH